MPPSQNSPWCLVSLFGNVLHVCGIVLLISGTARASPQRKPSPPPPPAQPTDQYSKLADEIQQWQSANPNACGEDTTNCRVEQLVEQFETCESPQSSPFRIVNGCEVNLHSSIGWQVAVHIDGSLCSGTMVSPRHVVLAAHCFKEIMNIFGRQAVFNPASPSSAAFYVSVSVAARRVSYRPIESRYMVLSFAIHPKFAVRYYDVAIVKLSRDVPFSTNGIRPACLPTTGTARGKAQNCIVSGYGVDNYAYLTGGGTLRYAVLSVMSDDVCIDLYGSVDAPRGKEGTFNKNISFCAIGGHLGRYTDTCLGDSGSGLLCKDEVSGRWTLQGVVSYGPQACATWPGVYAEAYALGLQNKQQRLLPQNNKCMPTRMSSNGGSFLTLNRKPGGIARTATDTVNRHGCTSNDQCQTSTCKQVVVCIGLATLQAKPGTAARPVPKEDENVLKQLSFAIIKENGVDERCARASICWAASWLKFYKNTVPTFHLNNL